MVLRIVGVLVGSIYWLLHLDFILFVQLFQLLLELIHLLLVFIFEFKIVFGDSLLC